MRPFPPRAIALPATFANQAVIALESARVVQELGARNRELGEALEQQTATAEILRVISSSPTDLQPIFQAIARSAVRLCAAVSCSVFRFDGELIHFVDQHGLSDEALATMRALYPMRPDPRRASARAILGRTVIHLPDLVADPEYPRETIQATGWRATLAVPMLQEGVPIGAIGVSRATPGPFTSRQIELLGVFAAQAVIAIENVRLFEALQARTRELARSVGELTALGEVGPAVSSTLDLETVLTTIVSRAVQLSETDGGAIYEFDEASQEFQLRATHGMSATPSSATPSCSSTGST